MWDLPSTATNLHRWWRLQLQSTQARCQGDPVCSQWIYHFHLSHTKIAVELTSAKLKETESLSLTCKTSPYDHWHRLTFTKCTTDIHRERESRDETLDSKNRSQKYTGFQHREAIPKATLIVKPEANLGQGSSVHLKLESVWGCPISKLHTWCLILSCTQCKHTQKS